MPALKRATRRIRAHYIEFEVVSTRYSRTIIADRRPAPRPVETALASVPGFTIVWTEVPAAHEVG